MRERLLWYFFIHVILRFLKHFAWIVFLPYLFFTRVRCILNLIVVRLLNLFSVRCFKFPPFFEYWTDVFGLLCVILFFFKCLRDFILLPALLSIVCAWFSRSSTKDLTLTSILVWNTFVASLIIDSIAILKRNEL